MSYLEGKAAAMTREFISENRKFGTFTKNTNGDIVAIHGRTLEVKDLSEQGGEPYFQAWVDGYQNDGLTHNEAVENALDFAKNDKRSN